MKNPNENKRRGVLPLRELTGEGSCVHVPCECFYPFACTDAMGLECQSELGMNSDVWLI